MRTALARPDVSRILNGLKDFQRRTVDFAFEAMYRPAGYSRRFLVADEVGLGKTLVARGLVAKAIDHLWGTTDRIDVVYICSNSSIARQNITRLNVTGERDFALASRITLLPTELHQLTARNLNFISFTPGTSFDLRSSLGTTDERVLLLHLLREAWSVRGAAPLNVMQGGAGAIRFRERVDSFKVTKTIEPTITASFVENLEEQVTKQARQGVETYRDVFGLLCNAFNRSDALVSPEDREARRHFVGALRALLARTCLQALQPDLIILDEFQRFKHLLDDEDESSELARALFDYSDAQTSARVLLLSATPYKMYTVDGEAGPDDHYQDFLATLRFLQDDPLRTQNCKQILKDYRSALLRLEAPDQVDQIRRLRAGLEAELRRVMVRTERLAATADRDGMLAAVPTPACRLAPLDLHAYLDVARLADVIEHGETIEYWKAAPYLLNFMEQYELRRKLERHAEDGQGRAEIAAAIGQTQDLLLDWADIEAYRRVDPGNARMRWLMHRTVESGAWRLLWVPPAQPTVALRGPFAEPGLRRFTKTLVFSSWRVVPKAIAAMLSYETERRIMSDHEDSPVNTTEARERKSPLLRFVAEAGGTAFTLVYPSFALGEAAEKVLHEMGSGAPERSAEEAVAGVVAEIQPRLEQLVARYATAAGEDEQWYWVAPVLLDSGEDSRAASAWLAEPKLAARWSGEEVDETGDGAGGSSALKRVHVPRLQQIAAGNPPTMGQPPGDLAEVLAKMALAAPGTAALRAIARLMGRGEKLRDLEIRVAAAQIGWGFRNLFNLLEVTALVRGRSQQPYWRRIIDYCLDGSLDAVLQEYAHVLREWQGFVDLEQPGIPGEIAKTMTDALGLRTATLRVDDVKVDRDGKDVSLGARGMRARFAVRLGEDEAEEGKRQERIDRIRKAFNSPFWPFVLATTSVGQEGLDFHLYCHAVAHWNLPSNPIDLEQREGRVHRYKGHAVRHNVAIRHGASLALRDSHDLWEGMFEEARKCRSEDATDLVPYWLYSVEGGVKIERHVPMLPLSRDVARLAALRESLALYRVVFGQPRQEDLMEFLLAKIPTTERDTWARELKIDLSP
jgi:hypothetical protein